MFIFSILVISCIIGLINYIPKSWLEKHIYTILDEDDPNF